ncbi:Golgi-associated PDZ and coiled-coil motif-containing protein-like isoform X2 [Galleria mellonella]|uniref:Golgi-associated PDZ and coiled-coil motif-containing protein-like isoform X2 n=1 Tax=Galleria mellonella TaxID=7137 RepID=A0ABM3MR71_GALME|nr:Golgi-associated PDZ and coiled-coil motif-containing protein-like isoform X2 [Galleria mellonella]
MSTSFIVKMATTGVGFRWLDILEKEFDKACVELDTSLSELETEEPEVVFSARQKIATLSSCFAQLTHKALTIFQNSAKLEAELVDMRAELVQARATTAGRCQDGGDAAGNVPEAARARSEANQLARENAALRETVLALHSELFGARLATKYLDKELAGRIQQLQLLGRDMRAELRDSLWAQVEAEILLQRHKTLVRVCRGVSPRPARPPPPALASNTAHAAHAHRARPRTVRVRRSPHLGLGISVTGGREHGVPILISELEAGGPAALTGELYVGDAILAINDLDLTQACHKEAVQALQSVKGDCALCVQFIATDDDDRLSEDNYRFPLYPEDGEVFGGEQDGSGATPTAPRTPDYTRPESEAGSRSRSGSGSRSGSACSSPQYRPPVAYPDYNSINNNLSILDMDDDSIKIEARLEPDTYQVPRVRSARSTPVHVRRPRPQHHTPQDWRTKGTYQALQTEASVAEPPPAAAVPAASVVPAASAAPTATAPDAPAAISRTTAAPSDTTTISDGMPESSPAVEQAPPPAVEADAKLTKHNGDARPLRRESKGFRIGSARRVMDSVLTNGDAERAKFPARLLAGDGDPDFGTPV